MPAEFPPIAAITLLKNVAIVCLINPRVSKKEKQKHTEKHELTKIINGYNRKSKPCNRRDIGCSCCFFDNSVSGPKDRLIQETNPTVH